MEEYKSNSHKSKDIHEKKVKEPVVKGAKVKKKSDLRKFADIFVPEDVTNVKSYIFLEVLVPALKKAISDVVTNGIYMLLYGEPRGRDGRNSAPKISYKSSYNDQRDRSDRRYAPRYSDVNVIVETRADAEEIIAMMEDIIETYHIASVADFYDCAGLETSPTDFKYGWTSMSGVKINPRRDGWEIEMPRRMPID